MPIRMRLFAAGAAVLFLEVVVLTPLAILTNLPAQFGGVGTDAGAEFIARGTAISAPLLPLLALAALVVLLLLRGERWAIALGAVGIGLLGGLFIIGALGEALSEGTREVSRSVLVASGVGVGAIGAGMLALAIASLRELRGKGSSAPAPAPRWRELVRTHR